VPKGAEIAINSRGVDNKNGHKSGVIKCGDVECDVVESGKTRTGTKNKGRQKKMVVDQNAPMTAHLEMRGGRARDVAFTTGTGSVLGEYSASANDSGASSSARSARTSSSVGVPVTLASSISLI
jgi:hypothetical protein